MGLYKFKLIEDGETIEDDIGVNLPNDEIACEYACDIVGELMNRREQRTRAWQQAVTISSTGRIRRLQGIRRPMLSSEVHAKRW